jgi:hypothetical protein
MVEVSDCAWTGAGLAVLLTERATGTGEGRLVVRVLDPDGLGLGLETGDVPDLSESDLALADGGFGVVWNDGRTGNAEIYFARFDAAGWRLAEDARISRSAAASEDPSVTWTGDSFGVAWTDSDGIDDAVYFAHFSVCP